MGIYIDSEGEGSFVFGDFRPISLIGCINKVVSKVLVNRLKNVIHKLISEEQSAFLSNRSILDGPLMLNEIIAWLNRSKKKGLLFKVDIDKAYDSLNWRFLDSVLEQMNFPRLWRSWVSDILSSGRASVLVNELCWLNGGGGFLEKRIVFGGE